MSVRSGKSSSRNLYLTAAMPESSAGSSILSGGDRPAWMDAPRRSSHQSPTKLAFSGSLGAARQNSNSSNRNGFVGAASPGYNASSRTRSSCAHSLEPPSFQGTGMSTRSSLMSSPHSSGHMRCFGHFVADTTLSNLDVSQPQHVSMNDHIKKHRMFNDLYAGNTIKGSRGSMLGA